MKAMMSTEKSEGRYHLRGFGPAEWVGELGGYVYASEAACYREARAILAETEPSCSCVFDHLYGRCTGAHMDTATTRAFIGEASALSEALAAFVGEE